LTDGGLFQKTALAYKLRLKIALEHQIVFQRVVQHQTVLVPVLRYMAHAGERAISDGCAGYVLPAEAYFAVGERLQPRKTVNQLCLSVAVDTGDTDDLAGAHAEGHVFHGVVFVHLGGHGHVLHIQDDVAGHLFILMDDKLNIAADHHAGQLFLGGVADVHGADALALAQDGAAVGHGHDLVELVGYEQDGLALLGKAAHDLHQLVNLLGRKHGCGLVEDEDLIFPVEHLQNFGALLHAHSDISDQRVGVHLEAVFFGKGHDLLPGLLLLEKARLTGLHAHYDVVKHSEAFHQLEVLMNHAYTESVGVVGVVYPDLHAVLLDYAGLGLI